MNILAVDTAGKTAGVALLQDDRLLYEVYLDAGMTHSETLMPMIDTCLKMCGMTCADIDLYGVNAGPGSFTGLRIGLAAVKGLAFPRETLCAPVSTLEALAAAHTGEGTVLCALDARRAQVYSAAFELSTHRRLLEDDARAVADLAEFVENCKKPLFFVGDGASLLEYIDFGTHSTDSVDYPDMAVPACDAVVNGQCEKALLFCGTGVGISMAANKIKGIRACCCSDSFSCEYTRRHNDANALCMGGRVVGAGLACQLVDLFLNTEFEGGRHQRRIDKLTALENR